MTDIITVLRAAETAAQWHAGQRRKGAQDEPYVNHLIEVATLVARARGSQETIVAAMLHDSIEDQKIDPALIAEQFGAEVAAIVLEVTDDKSLPKEVERPNRFRPPRARARLRSWSNWPTRSPMSGQSLATRRDDWPVERRQRLCRMVWHGRRRPAGYLADAGSGVRPGRRAVFGSSPPMTTSRPLASRGRKLPKGLLVPISMMDTITVASVWPDSCVCRPLSTWAETAECAARRSPRNARTSNANGASSRVWRRGPI